MQTRKIVLKTLGFLIAVAVLFVLLPAGNVQAATDVSTVQELVEALATGGEIIVTADIDAGSVSGSAFTVSAGKTVTLDLNGHTITGETSNGGIFANVGTLTISDNSPSQGGQIINTNTTQTTSGEAPKSAITNTGALTVNSGVIVTGPASGHGSWPGENFNPAYGIDNLGGGKVTVNGATISGAYGMRNFANVSGTAITINGGIITGKDGIAMQSFDNHSGILTINGEPTITGTAGSAIWAAGVTQYNEIVINGGTFSGEDEVYGTIVVVYGTVTINGGRFTGRNGSNSLINYGALVTITAGTFNGTILGGYTEYDGLTTFAPAEGKCITVNGDIGGNVVGADSVNTCPVLNVTQSTYHATIQEAIDAAADGDTILVGPGTYEEALILNKPNITVQSTAGAAATIIDVPDGNLTTGVKVLANMGTVTFEGFTVKNFTESGIVQGMSAREGTRFHVLNNIVIPKADYLRNGIQVTGDGSTVISNFVEGAYLTEDWAATAIGVVNASNVLVQGNVVSGAVNGIDFGILVYNWNVESMENIQILDNIIYNADYPMGVQAYSGTIDGVTFKYNQVTNYTVAFFAEVIADGGYSGVSVNNIDASPNWWGSIFGPAEDSIYGEVEVAPWCGDDECTFLVAGGTIDKTIELKEGDDLLLLDGTVIDPTTGSCFAITGDFVKIRTESLLGAVCKPGSPGITVYDGAKNIIIEGLEIDGTDATAGHGIDFLGAVTDVVIRDTFIHDMKGDGVHFAAQPGGYVELKGNLFMDNTGVGVYNGGTTAIDATYNAWGDYGGPTGAKGDGVGANVTYDPWTHVDVYVEYVGSNRYDNEVALEDETITYEVKANLQKAFGAEFTLKFDPDYLKVADIVNDIELGLVFTVEAEINVDAAQGTITFRGGSTEAKSGEKLTLYTVKFTPVATTPATPPNPLSIPGKQGVSLFGMNPGYGSSLNIYPVALEGVDDVNVYALPTVDIDQLDDYYVGNPKEFTLKVENPADGRDYTDAEVCLDLSGLPTGTVLEIWNDVLGVWVEIDLESLVGGIYCIDIGTLNAGKEEEFKFRVTFPAAGEFNVPVKLYDGTIVLVEKTFKFEVKASYAFAGSVQMQGRTVRAGVKLNLDGDYDYETTSTAPITGNFSFANVATGAYKLSITHDRYLSLKDFDLLVYKDILNWGRFELKGGDLNKNEQIDLADASMVGANYGATGDNPGDANFDSRVNIQDLAMVGGNYLLTNVTAYADWVPEISNVVRMPAGVAYDTLKEAVAAAQDGDVLWLFADLTIVPTDYMHSSYAVMVSGKSITLELYGHKLSSDASGATVYIGGTGALRVRDSRGGGAIKNENGLDAVGVYGTFVMESGALVSDGGYALYNYNYAGTMYGTSTILSGSLTGYDRGIANCGVLTIHDATIASTANDGVDLDNSGYLAITGEVEIAYLYLADGTDAPGVPDRGTLVLLAGAKFKVNEDVEAEDGATIIVHAGASVTGIADVSAPGSGFNTYIYDGGDWVIQ